MDIVKSSRDETKENSLLLAANPLILMLVKIRSLRRVDNILNFRKHLIQEFRYFDQRLQSSGCEEQVIYTARYCLCSALDEAILKIPWGHQSLWAQQSLLSVIHQETAGGEKFFTLLEEMTAAVQPNIDLLEFLYVLLSLGFEGKYHGEKFTLIDEIRYRLRHRIKMFRDYPEQLLSEGTQCST